jgi:hypothetical protein
MNPSSSSFLDEETLLPEIHLSPLNEEAISSLPRKRKIDYAEKIQG